RRDGQMARPGARCAGGERRLDPGQPASHGPPLAAPARAARRAEGPLLPLQGDLIGPEARNPMEPSRGLDTSDAHSVRVFALSPGILRHSPGWTRFGRSGRETAIS